MRGVACFGVPGRTGWGAEGEGILAGVGGVWEPGSLVGVGQWGSGGEPQGVEGLAQSRGRHSSGAHHLQDSSQRSVGLHAGT